MNLLQTLRSAGELRELAHKAEARLQGASAEEVVQWAAEEFGTGLAVACSMVEAVLPHMVSRVLPGVDVLFLDTGYHFAETLQTRDRVARSLPVTVVNVEPRRTVAEQDAEFGAQMHGWDPVQCCQMRKVAPLTQQLQGYEAWVSGIRRDESATRRDARVVEWDSKHALVKINPLVAWTATDVDRYVTDHHVVTNPLLAQGYPSIGCGPCTKTVAAGADERSGRWEGFEKTECGIHI